MFPYSPHPAARSIPLVAFFVVAGLVSVAASGLAQEPRPDRSAPLAGVPATNLPVTGVALFTSGVGYFQHDGVVEGDAEVTLAFSQADVNDLLKSLVLQDFDGGRIESVTYPSQDPLARILASFSLDVSDNPSRPLLLDRARGALIRITFDQASASARRFGDVFSGSIMGVERGRTVVDGVQHERALLNLVGDDGIVQVPLDDVIALDFADTALDAELRAALDVIAENRRQDRRSVTIRFSGEGRRRVRIGYVRAVPVWKTSYRLVIDETGGQVQGWAVVENTGESDWTDVELSLATGLPISFVIDLYSPIYVERPRVQPARGVAVAPQQYDRAVPAAPRSEAVSGLALDAVAEAESRFAPEPRPIDPGRGVSAAATLVGGSVYRVDLPVSVPRRGAAMIPIVQQRIEAERVSVFDPSVLSDRPLDALLLTNTTGLALPAGPVTVFDATGYAGDAQLPHLVADEDRLVSYAVDQGTSVLVETESEPETITRMRIRDGLLEVSVRDELTTAYVLDRIVPEARDHLVIHPRRSGWEVTSEPAPIERTAEALRFRVPVEGRSATTLVVNEQRTREQRVSLLTIRDDQIGFYLSRSSIDAATTRALERIRVLRTRLADAEAERQAIEREIASIYQEQERIRENLRVVESGTPIYQRYVDTLDAQEDQILELQRRLARARETEAAARDALGDYIDSL